MYLLIDNYDSFVYNLYQCFAREKIKLLVKRNDAITIDEIKKLKPEKIIISPGPKTPQEAGISNEVVRVFGKNTPILGVCLGHQCIAQVYGGKVVKVGKIVHGKTSLVYHDNKWLLKGVKNPFLAARYHSLKTIDLPKDLLVTSFTKDGIIMGIKHKIFPVYGLQFHPESFLTQPGQKIIRNFIKI